MSTPNQKIRAGRKSLGLTEAEVANRAGLSSNEYLDVELHEDEAFTVVHLRYLKKLCEILQLDLLGLFGIGCAYCGVQGASTSPLMHRSELIRTRRIELGMSGQELADRIGFETEAIGHLEQDPQYLEGWSTQLVVELAAILGLPPQVLLGVTCNQCGR